MYVVDDRQFEKGVEALLFDAMLLEAVEGQSQNLDGYETLQGIDISKIHRQLRKPLDKLREKLGIKTPNTIKKIGKKAKKLALRLKDNRKEVLAGVVAVVGLWYGGPYIFSALKTAGSFIGTAATAGVTALQKSGGQLGDQALLTQKKLNEPSGPTTVNDIDMAQKQVSSRAWLDQVTALTLKVMESENDANLNNPDFKNLLRGSVVNEQQKILADLEREKQAAIANGGIVPVNYIPNASMNDKLVWPLIGLTTFLLLNRGRS